MKIKNLSLLTNDELVSYYEELRKIEHQEYSMDMSGDASDLIRETFNPIWEKFEEEFLQREIQLCDCYESDSL